MSSLSDDEDTAWRSPRYPPRSSLADDQNQSPRKDFSSSRTSFPQEPSFSARNSFQDQYDSGQEDVFYILPKHPSAESLARWKRATLVLNAARRFRYTADIENQTRDKELSRLSKFRATSYAVAAANRFQQAGAHPNRSSFDKSESIPETFAELVQERDHRLLHELGGVEGVAGKLGTNIDKNKEKGLINDPDQIKKRQEAFGSNTYPRQPPDGFFVFVWDACKDPTLIILMICAVLSFIFGIRSHGIKEGWYDGVSIAFAVLLVVLVTSVSDYRQSLQFLTLNEEKRNIKVQVIRGGRRFEVSIFDLVVGDIVCLNIGDQVPADGLFVQGHSLSVDESSMTGESELVHVNNMMVYLRSGSKVVDGYGLMLVTGVGVRTEWGKLMAVIGEDKGEETPLQVRLNGVATFIGQIGLAVAVIVFLILFSFYFAGHKEGANGSGKFRPGHTSANTAANSVVDIFAIAVTIVVVAVPEGLPLAVTLTLAYAMKKMMADKALVRRLSACETMGSATAICTDKTGTLTLNQMTVVKAWVANQMRDVAGELKRSLPKNFCDVLFEGIAQNSTGSVYAPSDGETEVKGSPTEKAVLWWGLKNGMMYENIRLKSTIVQVETFNSVKKRAAVAVRVPGSDKIHVHWKGAAEIVLSESDKLLGEDNSTIIIDETKRKELINVIEGMAAQSLRCVAFAYREVDSEEVPKSEEQLEVWKIPESPLTLLAILGIKDPCRPGVDEAVRQCQAAGIKVRMVTGDSIVTAKAIAAECGILQGDDIAGQCVEGATFRNYNDEQRERELARITVMARSSPSDKLLMVKTLKQLGEVVAVTGDGTNDAPALHEADIGLAMGIQGTEVAKEKSDIVILDDNFASVVKVVTWGRSVYLNIQKFIQFQLTVNVAALTINFVAAVSSGDVPLTAVQLLWVNLIMDTLGALALATEPPTMELLKRPPVGRTEPLISNVMLRNILSQALYQVMILLTLQFKGKSLLKLNGPDADKINNTVIFNAFVLCQFFNEVNARKLEDLNIFKGLFNNRLFMGILGCTLILQVIIVEFLNKFASTTKLNWKFWIISIAIGFLSWPIAFVVKFIPVRKKPFFNAKLGQGCFSWCSRRQPHGSEPPHPDRDVESQAHEMQNS